MLEGLQPANDLTTQPGAQKADGMAVTVSTKDNTIKTFDKWFALCLDFDFSKHHIYSYGPKENLIVNLEFNSSEKVTLCSRDTTATYKFSDISLEYDAIFNKR